MARALPSFGVKQWMRWALDLAAPNPLIDLALKTATMRRFAQHVYFHKRGASGLSFAEFEARGGAVQRLPQEARSGTGRTYYNGRMVGPAPPRDRHTKHRPVE